MATAIRGRERRQDSGSARCVGRRDRRGGRGPRLCSAAAPTVGRVSTLRRPARTSASSAAQSAGRLTRSSVKPISASRHVPVQGAPTDTPP